MNTIRCSIVEDLLPLYIDGALREETAQEVREHLSACPACRNEYEKLAQTLTLPSAPDLQEEDRRAFQAFRRHWKRKKLQVALLCVVLTAAVVIAGCVVYQEVEVARFIFPHHHGGPAGGSDPRYMGTCPVGGRRPAAV